jgi:prolipoprotein diacylglyceryltransferase
VYVARALKNDRFVIKNEFYLAVGYYGLQRFVWEFIKPYGSLIGPFTLFHILSVMIFLYGVIMIATAPRQGVLDDRAFA